MIGNFVSLINGNLVLCCVLDEIMVVAVMLMGVVYLLMKVSSLV
jgi:hypothetical protein